MGMMGLKEIREWARANEDFIGGYLVIIMVAVYQGVLALSEVPTSFLYKDDFAMSPSQVNFVQSLVSLPWVFKPVYGILSDGFPIFGERRKSYMGICSFFAFINWMGLSFFVRDRMLGIIMLFNIQLSTAFCNVISEAVIVEITQKRAAKFNFTEEQQQAEAAKNVSLFFGVKSFGTLSTVYLGGYLMEKMDKHYIFAMTGIFPLFLCMSSFFMASDRQVSSSGVAVVGNSPATGVQGGEFRSERQRQISLFFKFLKRPEIYQPLIFILLFMLTPSSGSSMFFFYTNVLKFEPEFMGTLRFIHAAGSLIGVWMYNAFLKQVEFRKQFIVSTFICVALGLTQILLVTRKNVELGIPDKLFTLGDVVIIQLVGEINLLPILVLACRMCPKNIEATMYAMIMSTINLGSLISSQLGGIITYYLGISEQNFENLWILLLIANLTTCMPLIGIGMLKQPKNIDRETLSLEDEQLSSRRTTSSTNTESSPLFEKEGESEKSQYGTIEEEELIEGTEQQTVAVGDKEMK